jgi:hypothetical protein
MFGFVGCRVEHRTRWGFLSLLLRMALVLPMLYRLGTLVEFGIPLDEGYDYDVPSLENV